jgi:hypothetical protein
MKNIKTIFDKIQAFIKKINPKNPKFIISAILVLIMLTAGTIIAYTSYQEKAASGIIYKGLGPRQKSGPCAGIFEIKISDGEVACTHGPDPAPPGVDVRKRQEPGFMSKPQSVIDNHSKVAGITCDADGQSGRRVQVLYVRASDVEDRFTAFLPDLRATLPILNQQVIDSAAKTGGSRYVKFVHDKNCEPIIEHVVLSPSGDDSYANTARELAEKGYKKNNRKYFIWRDSNQLCGMGDVWLDDSPGLNNLNNIMNGNALVDNGCWGADTQLHELGHVLGAVQKSSPGHDSAHELHAKDPQDVLYYTNNGQRICLWDCGNDNYFSTNPAGGGYLMAHWNIAYNEFLGGDEDKRPKFVPGPAGDVYAVSREGASGKTEIHALSASSNFSDFSFHASSGLHATQGTTWSFAMGNFYDGDYIPDIYAINRSGADGKTEVHVLSGKSNFTDFVLQNSTGLETTTGDNWVFDVGNGPDDDPRADLFAINKQGGSGKTEVHILQGGPEKDYKDFSLHAATGLHATDKNWDFVLGSYSDNLGAGTDLYAINRRGASGKTEIHILSAESEYKDFILHATTSLEATDNSSWSFTTGYFDNDLKADLYAINRKGGSGKTEVHVLSAESDFKEFISHAASGLEPTNNSNWTFAPSQDFQSTSAPDPINPNNPDPQDPVDPNPVDPDPQDPIDPDPVNPDPTDPVNPDPIDPNPQDPVDPDQINPDDPPPFVCGGSPNSICTTPTVTIPPIDPGQEECIDPRSGREKIRDWADKFVLRVRNYFNAFLGNPQNPPRPPVPCVVR